VFFVIKILSIDARILLSPDLLCTLGLSCMHPISMVCGADR
jgi:hypothetical protein